MSSWIPFPQQPLACALWARELGIDPVLAQILLNRGVKTLEEADFFLNGRLAQLPPPGKMKDLERAVKRIRSAVANQEKILVWGDYDADGITATVLLVSVLKHLGAEEVTYHLPTRADGYGLKGDFLRAAKEQGVSLVLTVDCGVKASEEARLCKLMGLDLIITDHHEPSDELPEAWAVINPRRPDCPYPFKELAGVGVAFKLATALSREAAEEWLDVVALGTVADVMPLVGENRVLVREGLKLFNSSRLRPGLAGLLSAAGASLPVTVRTLSFVLAPRLNAAGRIGDPDVAARCLLAVEEEAEQWSRKLEELNRERQRWENACLKEADLLAKRAREASSRVLVVEASDWPVGLTGLIAQRLHSLYQLPAFVIVWEGEVGRGSGRADESFNVYQALSHASPYLLDYGGHAGAGGFTLTRESFPHFVASLEEYARNLPPDRTYHACRYFDAVLELEKLTPRLMEELGRLEPFGPGNPPPRLVAQGVEVVEVRRVGKEEEHLRLRLRQGRACLEGVAFGRGGEELPRLVDLVFEPSINELTGQPELKILDWWPAGQTVSFIQPFPAAILAREAASRLSLPFDVHLPEKTTPSLPRICRREALVDLREHPDRWRVLLSWLDAPVAVVVATPARACEVVTYLSLHLPERADQILLFYGGLEDYKEWLRKLATAGELPILVTTPALGGRFSSERDVILFDLLFSREQWEWLRGAGGRRLILLFNRQDREAARQRLHLLAPPRRVLLDFYRFLVRKAQGSNEVWLKPEEALARLKSAYLLSPGKETLRTVLQILTELDLVKELANGEEGLYLRLTRPKTRRFLPEAPTFAARHAFKREVLSFQRYFLEAPAEELKEFFRCDIIDPGGSYGAL
ncbi:single-stranded-DNA-specific exonuclease RecJ [Ammonifex degensii KC4]|uniref:Single-stranded-DNA-specific exonuclease RecJ n=1 Tax=Ammonifex degensii (strain DSM 10501 / KC4) TaxID=429009 RepID=C9RBA5_AMMDK|nr:single-stranded-DNA-specific exonuclease RecJ [Ammonifex degensii]ACX51532.1 single-stranded-DNA-specific exonuclease RecJ [Ammonifex degensii KC4]